ncbi:hypothetical protein VB264_03640 [Arcicella aquatica]|uniref:Uncharacterized protein n=1 Tax=Arcicella aquatica TaxID=217141 RepID=A0ABU5QII5_9BACT|nr:hypothetical protein [Arcicella aquatica]MEA5256862.1 hypothetical protein [Arcicella aquatica]
MDNLDFDPEFDFSNLDAIKLNKRKISFTEIVSVFKNENSCWYNLDGFPLNEYFIKIIGFSSSFRFLLLALNYQQGKIIFHQVEIANEEDIRKDYCGK